MISEPLVRGVFAGVRFMPSACACVAGRWVVNPTRQEEGQMKKGKAKKLVLSKESIRELTSSQLREAYGGACTCKTCTVTCTSPDPSCVDTDCFCGGGGGGTHKK